MISVLEKNRDTARGIAVVDESVTDAELDSLNDAGVVGIRFNQVQAGATRLEMLQALASRISRLGWHIQLHLTGDQLAKAADTLLALDIPVVLDHYARIYHVPRIASEVGKNLMRLLESGRVWLKFSAPYLSSQSDQPPYADLAQTVATLCQRFPDRLVWGTDWPHATEEDKPDDAKMLDWLAQSMPSPELGLRIFADNAAKLYRFQSE
ncbi:hypothetical protein WK01_17760 [Burkholderia cepacia]|nr:hypothetical protein WK01_17760 [Burkholderia cepacia]